MDKMAELPSPRALTGPRQAMMTSHGARVEYETR